MAQRHREWLAALPALTGKHLTTIGKLVNVAPSTLTRPTKEGDQGTSTLNAATIEKIIRYFRTQGVVLPWPEGDLRSPPTAPLRSRGFEEEATAFDHRAVTPIAAAVRAMISGREHVMPVTLQTRAIEGAGYMPGDVLLYDINGIPRAGDVVRAQVYDRNGEIEETVWRIYDAPYLVGLSRDLSATPKPLTVSPERVVVMGVVVGMIRPTREPAAA